MQLSLFGFGLLYRLIYYTADVQAIFGKSNAALSVGAGLSQHKTTFPSLSASRQLQQQQQQQPISVMTVTYDCDNRQAAASAATPGSTTSIIWGFL